MKYFLDTEFIEAPGHLDLVSIGIIAADGGELYFENSEVDWSRASPWVLENVRPHLSGEGRLQTRAQIAEAIEQFTASRATPPEFWGYYGSWDWTALCWLMGGMLSTPKGWPMFCRDLRQALDERGLQHIKQPDDAPHHALSDARWVATTWREHVSA